MSFAAEPALTGHSFPTRDVSFKKISTSPGYTDPLPNPMIPRVIVPEDFDRVQKTATSDEDLFDQMTVLYPDWVANQSWLMFGFPGA